VWMGSTTAVAGTSCATPTFAGVVSQLNDIRLNNNKPPLGLLSGSLATTGVQRGVADRPHEPWPESGAAALPPQASSTRCSTRLGHSNPRPSTTSPLAATRRGSAPAFTQRWAGTQPLAGAPRTLASSRRWSKRSAQPGHRLKIQCIAPMAHNQTPAPPQIHASADRQRGRGGGRLILFRFRVSS
jgi:hypothetical protein